MIGIIVKQPKWKKLKQFNNIISTTTDDRIESIDFENVEKSEFDFFVQNGIKKKVRPTNYIYEAVEEISQRLNKPILIREAPVIRQLLSNSNRHGGFGGSVPFEDMWIKLSWNSFFMDDGVFPYDSSYRRWDQLSSKYNIRLHDWKRRGDAILINLQVAADSALNRLTYNDIDYKEYMSGVIDNIKQHTDRPIIVRSHPLDHRSERFIQREHSDIEFSTMPDLYDDLNRAWCMITYNSTSSVESVLYGTPTITLDSSAVAAPVSGDSILQIEDSLEFDRSEWCNRIAFQQWKGDEFSSGYVWNLLKECMPR